MTKWDNCLGTFTFATRSKYVGEWKNGKWDGQEGTYTYANGDKYVGEFKDGKLNAQINVMNLSSD